MSDGPAAVPPVPLRVRPGPDSYYHHHGFYATGDAREATRYACRPEIINDLREYGFSLVQMCRGRMDSTMRVSEDRRFALSRTTKHRMTCVDSIEEGYVAGAHKQMFHFTAQSGSVQKPPYWDIQTAPACYLDSMKETGGIVFNGINAHALNLLSTDLHFQQESFTDRGDYVAWINAVQDSSAHLLTSFLYEESNPAEFHAVEHIDKGLITICSNPTDLEVYVKGQWVPLGPQRPSVVAILTGHTLEHATNGLFRAALHRVCNNGARRSRVIKMRLDPSLVIHPASVIARVPASLVEDLPLPKESLDIRELMHSFARMHSSVNAAASASRHLPFNGDIGEDDIIQGASLGYFDMLPSNLVFAIFDWLRDIKDLYRLSLVNRALRRIANSQALCIPAAESSHIDWGVALDRIDLGVESHARPPDVTAAPMAANELLESVSTRWIRVIGHELTAPKGSINIRIRDQVGDMAYFRVPYHSQLQKVFNTYAQQKEASLVSLRFLLDGERISGDQTGYSLELENNEQIDCMPPQYGD